MRRVLDDCDALAIRAAAEATAGGCAFNIYHSTGQPGTVLRRSRVPVHTWIMHTGAVITATADIYKSRYPQLNLLFCKPM